MGGIAQHLDRLDEGIEQRRPGRDRIHEDGAARRLQHPSGFAQRSLEIMPVMGAEAAEDEVEAGVGEGQFLDHALLGADIREAALGRRLRHRAQHVAGEIIGDDLAHMRRHAKADMPATAAEIEDPGLSLASDNLGQRLQILALGMDCAVDIGGRPRTELAGNQAGMGFL